VKRSSASVAANISEGFGRESRKEFARFLRIAQGSLKETETHILLSIRLEMLTANAASNTMLLTEEVGKMLGALIRKIEHESR